MNLDSRPLPRAFLIACGLALVASGTMLYLGDTRGSAAALIFAASALTFSRARRGDLRFRRRYWLGLGLLAGGLVILGFPIGIVASLLASLFVLQLLLNAFVARKIGRGGSISASVSTGEITTGDWRHLAGGLPEVPDERAVPRRTDRRLR